MHAHGKQLRTHGARIYRAWKPYVGSRLASPAYRCCTDVTVSYAECAVRRNAEARPRHAPGWTNRSRHINRRLPMNIFICVCTHTSRIHIHLLSTRQPNKYTNFALKKNNYLTKMSKLLERQSWSNRQRHKRNQRQPQDKTATQEYNHTKINKWTYIYVYIYNFVWIYI